MCVGTVNCDIKVYFSVYYSQNCLEAIDLAIQWRDEFSHCCDLWLGIYNVLSVETFGDQILYFKKY